MESQSPPPARLTQAPPLMGSPISSDDIFRKHQLPPVLSKMDETARVQIAYAYETRGVLESERKIAEHAYRKMVLVTKTYQLRLLTAQRKLLEFDEELSALVNAAVLDLETFLGGEEHDNMAPVRTDEDARHVEAQICISPSSSP